MRDKDISSNVVVAVVKVATEALEEVALLFVRLLRVLRVVDQETCVADR